MGPSSSVTEYLIVKVPLSWHVTVVFSALLLPNVQVAPAGPVNDQVFVGCVSLLPASVTSALILIAEPSSPDPPVACTAGATLVTVMFTVASPVWPSSSVTVSLTSKVPSSVHEMLAVACVGFTIVH